MSSAESRRAFFRQSTWMMAATVASGACMFLVHQLSKHITPEEYAILVTLLQLLVWLSIPAVGLQMVFAQLAAAAIDDEKLRQLRSATRSVFKGAFAIWIVALIVIGLLNRQLVAAWNLPNAWPLGITLMMGLMALVTPILIGLLQGRQNFLWMGWATIANGGGRLLLSFLIVFFVSATALGILVGALLGLLVMFSVAAWQCRTIWIGPTSPFDWTDWGRRLAGLTTGFGAFLFMTSADLILIKAHFDDADVAAYGAVGTLARAIVTFTAPLAAVMFPKIVSGVAHSTRSDTLLPTFIGATVLSVMAALGLTFLSPIVIRLGFNASFASMSWLMPWFAWSMVPLAIANVLINNLMAQSRFGASPVLALVAVGYGFALAHHQETLLQVVKVIGTFNCLLLAVASVFTWLSVRPSRPRD